MPRKVHSYCFFKSQQMGVGRHLLRRCLRVKAWGKAHQAEFGTQALSSGDADLPSTTRPWYSWNGRKGGKQQTSAYPANKSQGGEIQRAAGSAGKTAWLLPALTVGTMAMPSPPACPTGHAQPGRPTPSQTESGITLVRGLCGRVLSLVVKMSMQGMESMQGKQGHSSFLNAPPSLALLCACPVRGQGQGVQQRGRLFNSNLKSSDLEGDASPAALCKMLIRLYKEAPARSMNYKGETTMRNVTGGILTYPKNRRATS